MDVSVSLAGSVGIEPTVFVFAVINPYLAGKLGFEPRSKASKAPILPLDDFPINSWHACLGLLPHLFNIAGALSEEVFSRKQRFEPLQTIELVLPVGFEPT